MLVERYRNINIGYDDNTKILKYSKDIDTIKTQLNPILDNIENQVRRGNILDKRYVYVRLDKSDLVIIYINPQKSNAPFFAYLNVTTPPTNISPIIPHDVFLKLKYPQKQGTFEFKCAEFLSEKYIHLQNDAELTRIEEALFERD